jgi:Aerotolerance regulator N-terminal
MTFIHPLLLGGLVLAGIPVLLHLIMRQKPKRLSFPAFRFLVQRARSNQRKLQLRHLLLLLLRILLIALICLALARPKVLNEGLNLSAGQPLSVALVFDTSASMEYKVGDRNRLDEAKRRALELLDDLPDGSRVAVFDSGEPVSGEWLQTFALARERIANLQIRPANYPVTDAVFQAYRLLGAVEQEDRAAEPMPRFVYVFSDRTQDSWDDSRRAQLVQLRDGLNPKANAAFVDVGVDKPENLAITDLELRRQVIPANDEVVLTAKLQATGRDYDTEVICRIDNDEKTKEHKPLTLAAGKGTTVQFRRRIPAVGLHQVEVTLGAPDHLPFSAVRYATFEVRGPRQVLIITDHPNRTLIWEAALRGSFQCDVVQPAKAADLTPRDLANYQAVCLFDVADPTTDLWEKLKRYVEDGGGLVVLPGGSELRLSAYKDEGPNAAVTQLLPGVLDKEIENDAGVEFDEAKYREPMRTWWRDWVEEDQKLRSNGKRLAFMVFPPKTVRYWAVRPVQDEFVIAAYAGEGNQAALLMKTFPRGRKAGRVVLFTTAMDDRKLHDNKDRRCNNYLETPFYFTLANKLVDYLAGGADAVTYNYGVGQTVPIALPATPRFPMYTLQGPGLGAGAVIPLAANQGELKITQAVQPGQFTLANADSQWKTGFSANVSAGECNLTRLPKETIEAVFGPNSVLAPGHNTGFKDALQEHWTQPVELFPWLMILLLLALALENLLANRFYRKEEPGEPGATGTASATGG